MGKKGVESMIEEIKVYIENCKPMPLSQTKISVQKPELLSMLDELELKLPGEIERCKKIMRNKEMILADARTRSDAIITESVNEANRMIEQNEITRLANIRADEILENARNQAQQIVANALGQYGDKVEVVFCNNDAMALGALQAIQSAGRTVGTDIYLVGVDALSEALEDVLAGTMTGTVFNDHFSQSHSAADAAINYLSGAGNEHYIGCDYVKVTKDNAQEILDMVK